MDIVVGSMIGLSIVTIVILGVWYWNYRRKLWFISIESCLSNNFEYVITMSNHRGKQFRFRGLGDVWFEEKTGERLNKKREAYLKQIYTQYEWDQTNHQSTGN